VQLKRWSSVFGAALIAVVSSVGVSSVAAAEDAGLRPDAPPPTVNVNVQAFSPVNFIAEQVASDVEGFWSVTGLPGRYFPPTGYAALPAPIPSDVCLQNLRIARFCSGEVAWDVPEMEQINTAGGALAVADVMAHEMGHQIQASLNSPVSERGADCLAGVYLASVASGASPRFMGSVEDVQRAAEAAFAVGGEGPEVANSRVAALNTGLMGTADNCLAVYTD
jgi:hypothetical protein